MTQTHAAACSEALIAQVCTHHTHYIPMSFPHSHVKDTCRQKQLSLTDEQEEALGEQLRAVLAHVAHGAQVPVLRVPVPRAPLQLRQRHHLGGRIWTLAKGVPGALTLAGMTSYSTTPSHHELCRN